MELLDRYLQAVRFWLPRRQRDDIAAELSEGIGAEVREKEGELGRPLDDAEMETVLKRWGHPVLVAARYLPAQHLIGPALFPMYTLALKAVFLLYLVPWLLVWLGLAIFDPGYRAAHPGLSQLDDLGTWWLIAVHAFALVTVVFALVGKLQATAPLELWVNASVWVTLLVIAIVLLFTAAGAARRLRGGKSTPSLEAGFAG